MASTALLRQTTSAKDEIHALAARHGITHRRSALDELADAITAHAGDVVTLDDTESLLVELGRAKLLVGSDRTLLHARYLRERAA